MINNFKQIKSLLKFDSEDDFYFLQIIKRKKEHPEMPKSVKVVATRYIYSFDKLDELQEEIIHMCEYHNARAYINLNKRSFERLAFQTLKQVTDCIMNKEYKYIRKSYNIVCGRFSNEHGSSKKWIIDVDLKTDYRFVVAEKIRQYEPNPGESKVITYIETKNGWHIITKPFNTATFNKDVEIDHYIPEIHKDNPTILYIP